MAALEERVGAAEEALAGTAARSRVASLEGRLEESLSTLHALEEAVKTSVRDSSERYASVVEELRHKEDGAKVRAADQQSSWMLAACDTSGRADKS